ncbi:MAG: winged helix-turn-helix domain-containing protein, partial [Woeseiaceae bacterium]
MIYRFKTFELDTDRFELRESRVPVPIEPQVFALLALLVSNSDRMISKEEMIERIWNGRVISDAALSSRIKSVRRVLGDDGKSQRLIRTVHGRGFRFVGDVVPADKADRGDQGPKPASTDSDQTDGSKVSRPAIAVLPFLNLSGDTDQEYFSDAITQDIITNLSKHRWLDVVARNTSFGYKGKSIDVRQLVRDLGV